MSDDSYVHDPGAPVDSDADSGDDCETPGDGYPRNTASTSDAEFDWRGWLLVVTVVVAFLVIPGALYVLPSVRGAVTGLGLGFRHTYLVLPLIPAFLLGTVAVWSAVRSRSR